MCVIQITQKESVVFLYNKGLSILFPPQVAQILYGAHVVDDDRSLRDNIRGIGHVEFRDDTRFGRPGDHYSLLYPAIHGSYETTSWRTTKSPFQLGSLVRRQRGKNMRS